MWQPLTLQSQFKHVRTQRKVSCLQSDFALRFGTSNWPQAHTPPVRGAHPAGSRNCHEGWQLVHSPVALHRSQKAPSLQSLWHCSPAWASALSQGNFLPPSQVLTYRYRPPLFQSTKQGALCYNFCSRTPHPIPGIQLPFSTQSSPRRKAIKTAIALRPRARAASKEAGRKQPPRLPIQPVSQAAGRAASCQSGKRAAALLPSPSRENFDAAL